MLLRVVGSFRAAMVGEPSRQSNLNPTSEIERRARPLRALFSALSRKTRSRRNDSSVRVGVARKTLAARRGQPHPRRVCSPNFGVWVEKPEFPLKTTCIGGGYFLLSPSLWKERSNFMRRPRAVKTRKAVAKRFKITATGKIMRNRPGKRHLLSSKNAKRRRRLGTSTLVADGDRDRVILNLPFSNRK